MADQVVNKNTQQHQFYYARQQNASPVLAIAQASACLSVTLCTPCQNGAR